jgi:hypothetical protein
MLQAQAADPVSYALESAAGRLVIRDSAGDVHPWTSYTLTSHRDFELWEEMYEPFFEAKIHLFQLQIWPGREYWSNTFWSHDGEPVTNPERAGELEEQVQRILKRDPDARPDLARPDRRLHAAALRRRGHRRGQPRAALRSQ